MKIFLERMCHVFCYILPLRVVTTDHAMCAEMDCESVSLAHIRVIAVHTMHSFPLAYGVEVKSIEISHTIRRTVIKR